MIPLHPTLLFLVRRTNISSAMASQTGLYADRERGRYPIWESLDHPNYFPGSGILFCTVTVRLYHLLPLSPL